MTTQIETEFMKATKLRQGEGEARSKYLKRLLTAGQSLTDDVWATLSTPAQSWYNSGVTAYKIANNTEDIPEPVDPIEEEEEPVLAVRGVKPPVAAAPIEEPEDDEALEYGRAEEPEDDEAEVVENGEDEEEEEDENGEEEATPVEEPPVEEERVVQTAPRGARKPSKPAPKPAAKPAPKPAAKPPKKAAAAADGNSGKLTKPPKVAPGASTFIKRMLLKDMNVTNAELMEQLREEGVSVTPITVSTIRSDFKHSLKVLQEAGYATEVAVP